MNYVSTRNKTIKITSSEAILQGLASDGGLFVPEDIPSAGLAEAELISMDQYELTSHVLSKLLDDLDIQAVSAAVENGYKGKFSSEDLTPVVGLGSDSVLELYHGPTSAFKDMALCILPHLIAASCRKNGVKKDILILTATSGDTGKAALAGFADAPQTKVMVFFPAGGVSDIQRLQMITQEGKNVCVCGINGNFDDAQRGVKNVFSNVKSENVELSSANSINIGRLAPQVAYYFKAYADLLRQKKIAWGDKINFVVPTGNFGNILAGYLAKRMGLPVGKLICASNKNDVLTEFISTGKYNRLRPFYQTASPSMDILVSSNLERLLYFASGCDDELVRQLMNDLNEKGSYKVSDELLATIKSDFLCGCASDEESLASIKKVWENFGYLMDPHTAVAYTVLEKIRESSDIPGHTVILSTASPYKFSGAMLEALGSSVPADGFESMEKLNDITKVPVPENLASLKDKKILHKDIINPDEIIPYVQRKAEEKIWVK